FQAEDGIRDSSVTGVQTCALPISLLDVLDAHPGKVTLSITPVLADQLEAPGALGRCLEFLRTVRPASHKLDADDGFDVAYSAAQIGRASCRDSGEVPRDRRRMDYK